MARSTEGFERFDGSQKETFAAGLVLLCLDEDAAFREAFGDLVRSVSGMDRNPALREWGREVALEVEHLSSRRCDLWLRYDDGLVLVEIKTHSAWDPASVSKQMVDQRSAKLGGRSVMSSVLLAPSSLLRRLPEPVGPALRWSRLIEVARRIEPTSQVLRLACEHWSRIVERDFGITGPALAFADVAAQSACVVAFLRAAFARLDGQPRGESVWFSSPDGEPDSKQGWKWFGIAVPGQCPHFGRIYLGVYTYVQDPDSEGGNLGTFVEAYRLGNDDDALASIRFDATDLSTSSLEALLARFVAALAARAAAAQQAVAADGAGSGLK